jgi:hypothetical protein
MLIDFERTGGFAGMFIKSRIDTDDLPAEQAAELESLVNTAEFFKLPSRVDESTGGADRFNYSIGIVAEGKKHTVEISDETAPPSLRPLLRRLTILARSHRIGD